MTDTGIFRSHGADDCDICGQQAMEAVNVESAIALIRICAACARLVGEMAEEIEPSGGGAS